MAITKDVKFTTVPSKRLKKALSSSDMLLTLNNIKNWANEDGESTDLTSADFSEAQYVSLRDKNNTRLELIEIDPSTIADPQITILKRGLPFSGENTETPTLKQSWTVSGTIVELGTHTPQALESLVRRTKENTFTVLPKVEDGVTGDPLIPTEDSQLTSKKYTDEEIQEVEDGALKIDGSNKMAGTLDLDDNDIVGVKDIVAKSVQGLDTPTAPEVDKAANVQYVNDVSIAGAADASEVGKGIVQEATQAEVDSLTDIGSTGAKLFITPSKAPLPYWNSLKEYSLDDMSWYNGSVYKSLFDSNTNNEPNNSFKEAPFDTSNMVQSTSTVDITGAPGDFSNGGIYYFYRTSTTNVVRKTMSTPYDLSTETATVNYTIPAVLAYETYTSLKISPDGTKLYIIGDGGIYDAIYQFSTSTAYDFSSNNYDGSGGVSTSSTDGEHYGFDFSSDGLYVFTTNRNDDNVLRLPTTSAWNVVGMPTGVDGTQVFYVNGITPYNITFVDNGNKMFISSSVSGYDRIYNLSTPYDPSTSGSYVTIPSTAHFLFDVLAKDGSHYYSCSNTNYYSFLAPYWTNAAEPTGYIVTIGFSSSYTVAYDGHLSFWCGPSGDGNNDILFNGSKVSEVYRGGSDTVSIAGSFSLPCKIGDTITKVGTGNVSGIITIRKY